ncbi:hypothetical protein DDW09_00540 [Sulfolobus sp. SCGC AB-777_L09]|jgi:hypothetical protein|nr:DUF5622 domain-containing protein [Sulfolobaceae archaeon]PVU71075.1 hypothetical protein DDW09_00540 [Sulfolobus sp. SCGC AB-777_L09]
MTAKHGKYIYVEIEKGKIAKIRFFKGIEESKEEAYLITGKIVKKIPRKAKVKKLDDLPEPVKEKLRVK